MFIRSKTSVHIPALSAVRMIAMKPIKSRRTWSGESIISKTFLVWLATGHRIKKTLRADLYLSGITLLITVLLVDNIHQHDCIRSVKRLTA